MIPSDREIRAALARGALDQPPPKNVFQPRRRAPRQPGA
jgi:hypothetical protein